MDDVFKDERFKSILSDPKFRGIPKSQRKVKIDKRFESMFTDDRFQLKYTVDKRGRPINQTQAENYKKYYDLSESESEDAEGSEGESESKESTKPEQASEDANISTDANVSTDAFKEHLLNKTKQYSDSELEDETDKVDQAKMNSKLQSRLQDMSLEFARGVGSLYSDESSSDESSSEESESENIEHNWGELDKNADVTEEATHRLAVCNMDWDRINATDIMVLFQSFLPSEGVVESVTIYPSEFGLERMKEEEISGPKELVEQSEKSVKLDDGGYESDDNSEGSRYHMEKLRQYQLNRLKYYYAVVVCNSAETANKLYTECDGMEYESSATKVDLRFIPDDMTFDQEPKEVCSSPPDLKKYMPRLFANTALQQIKVDLTWDETDPNRVEFTKKIQSGEDLPEDNLKEYIATSSEEEDSEKEDGTGEEAEDENAESDVEGSTCGESKKISKYRSLLAGLQDKKEKKEMSGMEMEVTWGVGSKEKDRKQTDKKYSQLTPIEKILEKKKQKKKLKKEKLKPKDDDNLCSDDDIPSDVDLNDPFFGDELKDHKKKMKKKHQKTEEPEDEESERRKQELELLLAEDGDEKDKNHFSLKGIMEMENMSKNKKKKWRKKKKDQPAPAEDNFKVDVNDERFSAMYSSHLFNIDPADPHFKKTKAMEEFIAEKHKRKSNPNKEQNVPSEAKKPKVEGHKLDPELSRLVKSIKKKNKLL